MLVLICPTTQRYARATHWLDGQFAHDTHARAAFATVIASYRVAQRAIEAERFTVPCLSFL